MVKSKSPVLKSSDPKQYKKYIYYLCRTIRMLSGNSEPSWNPKDACRLWKGSYTIMGSKAEADIIAGNNGTHPNELNAFCTSFEHKVRGGRS